MVDVVDIEQRVGGEELPQNPSVAARDRGTGPDHPVAAGRGERRHQGRVRDVPDQVRPQLGSGDRLEHPGLPPMLDEVDVGVVVLLDYRGHDEPFALRHGFHVDEVAHGCSRGSLGRAGG
jgi:hypothetical protein